MNSPRLRRWRQGCQMSGGSGLGDSSSYLRTVRSSRLLHWGEEKTTRSSRAGSGAGCFFLRCAFLCAAMNSEIARPNTNRVVDAHVCEVSVLAELVDSPRPTASRPKARPVARGAGPPNTSPAELSPAELSPAEPSRPPSPASSAVPPSGARPSVAAAGSAPVQPMRSRTGALHAPPPMPYSRQASDAQSAPVEQVVPSRWTLPRRQVPVSASQTVPGPQAAGKPQAPPRPGGGPQAPIWVAPSAPRQARPIAQVGRPVPPQTSPARPGG